MERRNRQVVRSAVTNEASTNHDRKGLTSFIGTLYNAAFDPRYTNAASVLLILTEIILCPLIINFVPYTEIDWQAYMDQVQTVHNGTYDYSKIFGRIGPLVYPAGFVWFFYALRYLTSGGVVIRIAQYIFALFYLLNLVIVLQLYRKTQLVPPIALMFLTFGAKRVHSIFLLRMFNDPVAMLFAYASFWALLQDWPIVFCALYSLSVSIKMNTLLFAPAVLLILYYRYGLFKTIHGLMMCAAIQISVALPFLTVSWWSYAWKAFEFRRKFMHEWTVNYRFLPEWLFDHEGFHIGLLACHVLCLVAAYYVIWTPLRPLLKYAAVPSTNTERDSMRRERISNVASTWWRDYTSWDHWRLVLSPNSSAEPMQLRDRNRAMLLILFSANLIGIAFARSLHYQFYSWYFHQLPFLLWNTPYPMLARLIILGAVEFCYLVFPSTVYSSALLHVCHVAVIVGLFLNSSGLQQRRVTKSTHVN